MTSLQFRYLETDEAISSEIGRRIEGRRLQKNLTQKQVAKIAGVSIPSVQRLESGEVSARLSTLIAICRALDLLDHLDMAFPRLGPQPVDLLLLQGKQRQRARQVKEGLRKPWNWGESS